MPQRSPERSPETPRKKPRSAPAKKPKKSGTGTLLTIAALGGIAGGVILGKRTWDSLSDLQKLKAGQKIVDAKIPVVSDRVQKLIDRRKAEKGKKMVDDFNKGVNDALGFLGKKLGIEKKPGDGK